MTTILYENKRGLGADGILGDQFPAVRIIHIDSQEGNVSVIPGHILKNRHYLCKENNNIQNNTSIYLAIKL